MFAVLAPGQGAQAPGLLAGWAELPGAGETLAEFSAAAGRDLAAAGLTGAAEEIRDTAVAQPLLVAAGLLAVRALFPDGPPAGAVAAGHSVGEITAVAVAGVLDPVAAVRLAAVRGAAMADAAAAAPGGMTAVLGGDPDEVAGRLRECGLCAANVNGAGQVVAAGPPDALARLAADPPPRARLRPLAVAGAFHTAAMAPARVRLAAAVAELPARHPVLPVVSNADGQVLTQGPALLARLVDQLTAPVRWDRCLATLAGLRVSAVVELPPAGTLSALVRRELPEVRTLALKSPADLTPAAELLAELGAPAPVVDALALVVAPGGGVFHRLPLQPGALLTAGTQLGTVAARDVEEPARCVGPGRLVEWLADTGDPVRPGQPLARLDPIGPVATW